MGTCSFRSRARAVAACAIALTVVAAIPAGAQEMAAEVLRLVNEQRAAAGVAPLARSSELETAAQQHSTDMATRGFFNHVNPDGVGPADRIVAAGYRWNTWGENIAVGYATARAVMDGWMRSPGHRANLLNPNFKEIGIGVVYRAGSRWGYYWTQDFGARPGIRTTPTPQAPPADPVVESLLPANGPEGPTITIAGTNLGAAPGGSRVMIRNENDGALLDAAAIRIDTWSDTRITLTLLLTDPSRATTDAFHLWVRRDTGDGRYRASNALVFAIPSGP